MNKQLRLASLVLVLGLILGFGYWQQQGWAAGGAGKEMKQVGNKLKQLFSLTVENKAFSVAPRLVTAPVVPPATIVVTNFSDAPTNPANCPGVNCRLRDAVAAVADGGTI